MRFRSGWSALLILLPALALAQESSPDHGPASLATVDSLILAGSYAAAEQQSRDLLATVEAEQGAESIEAAEVLDRLVEALTRGGKGADPSARALAERAVRIKEARLGPGDPGIATSLNGLGRVLGAAFDHEAARVVFERALAIRESALGPDHPDVARSLTNLGLTLKYLGDYKGARPLLERALAVSEKSLGPDDPFTGLALNNLGYLLQGLGDYEGARPLYERAVAVQEKTLGVGHPSVGRSLNNLGILLTTLGDYEAARTHLERGLAVREKALGPEHPDVAGSLGALGNLLHAFGDRKAARQSYERALAIMEKAAGPDSPGVVWCLNGLAVLLDEGGDLEGARSLLERAVAIMECAYGPDHPSLAAPLHNLACVVYNLGERATARSLYERAVAVQEKAFGPGYPELASSLAALGLTIGMTDDYEKGRSLLERALALAESARGPNHPEIPAYLDNLDRLLAMHGETGRALDLALRAEEIGREHLRLTARSLSEREALEYVYARSGGRALAITLAPELEDPARRSQVWDAELRSRAVVLDEMCRRRRSALESGDPDLMALCGELSAARKRLAELVVRGAGAENQGDYRYDCDAARAEKERLERELANRSESFRSQLRLEQIGFQEVREALPPGSALVAFSRYTHGTAEWDDPSLVISYAAFVLPGPGEDPIVIALGPGARIDSLVARWQREAAGVETRGSALGEARCRRAGDALRRAVWDPVAERLGGAAQVCIVPDGAISLVAFGSLPEGEHRYLIESDLRMHYLSAERDLVAYETAGFHGDGLLALGDPDFDASVGSVLLAELPPDAAADTATGGDFRGRRSTQDDFESLRFTRLPATEREVRDLASVWRGTERDVCLVGPDATEEAMKTLAPGRRVLHLATHGFFVDETGSAENPLLLSGLALAGANRRDEATPEREDGVLTAEEVGALDLSGVEWAVLSACKTGVGEVKGHEGVLGLRRAFQVAGVGTVIMSLWEVEDEATREWMEALYDARFREGLSTADAMREATLTVLSARRERGESTHPFFWGAFIAAGDWR